MQLDGQRWLIVLLLYEVNIFTKFVVYVTAH